MKMADEICVTGHARGRNLAFPKSICRHAPSARLNHSFLLPRFLATNCDSLILQFPTAVMSFEVLCRHLWYENDVS